MAARGRFRLALLVTTLLLLISACSTPVRINHVQFIGSHNSYKQALTPEFASALAQRNPGAAAALDYAHVAIDAQLDLGLRKLEIDLFNSPDFAVGHVQQIDMVSHCATLALCLRQVRDWSDAHPGHVPIWISFNLKDSAIEGLPKPAPFDAPAMTRMDRVIEQAVGDRLIRPADTVNRRWPTLASARGKLLLILDEGGAKQKLYETRWQTRPLHMNVAPEHPAAGIMIINDPIANRTRIAERVAAGYLVRTRADADTQEARSGSTARREAALNSGAQAISTDYYLPDARFGTGYQVRLQPPVRCNPVSAPPQCAAELSAQPN
ncbi:MAG: Ca2+-dependent phosphoinositide-specific phospholipase C [Pseudomonadales bacterium]